LKMRSESSVIPFLVPHRKVWLTPTARVRCSNAANIGERKTWTQSAFCTWQNSVRARAPKIQYSVAGRKRPNIVKSLVDLQRHSVRIGVGPGDIVLDGDLAPPKGTQPSNFRPMSVVAKRSPSSATAEQLLQHRAKFG